MASASTPRLGVGISRALRVDRVVAAAAEDAVLAGVARDAVVAAAAEDAVVAGPDEMVPGTVMFWAIVEAVVPALELDGDAIDRLAGEAVQSTVLGSRAAARSACRSPWRRLGAADRDTSTR
jgi:hypothetical protein